MPRDSGSTPPAPARISRVAGPQQVTVLLSATGWGSANAVARLMAAGRVAVNGRTVRDSAARANPDRDTVTVDGAPVDLASTCRYLALYKPFRVLTSFTDPDGAGRPTLGDYVPLEEIYAVGRLDYDSEGLMLLTDDGWLNHRLAHPDFEHPKTYLVQVEGIPDDEALEALRRGVTVKGERTLPAEVTRLAEAPDVPPRDPPIRERRAIPTTWLRVVLREGRKRQLRHMTAAVGYPTLRLVRVAIGPIRLEGLLPGQWRHLSTAELDALAASLRARRRPAGAGTGASGGRPTRGSSNGEKGRRGNADPGRGRQPR